MNRTLINRRGFIGAGMSAVMLGVAGRGASTPDMPDVDLEDRVRGLVLGSAIGDALGGPIEFQAADAVQGLMDPPKAWRDEERWTPAARAAAVGRLRLRSYRDLRPGTESYGQWNPDSEPGTITDDTRHKLILLHALRGADRTDGWPVGVADLARAYIEWPETEAIRGRTGYGALAADWLEEWQLAARWVLGERDLSRALPPGRMWQGLPTCCGQMTLLPLAALFPGRPQAAYLAAYHLAFFDNGFGRDLNAALVAGLAQALVLPSRPDGSRESFDEVIRTLRDTDPLRFGAIRWTERAVDRWLRVAFRLVREADGRPARLFAALEREFAGTIKWEAQVPFVVAIACLDLAGGDPLAALQLSMEWGHDTDSYAQLVGAFAGAMHGAALFPEALREPVVRRLIADHGVDLEAEARFLARLGSKETTPDGRPRIAQ